MPHGESLDLNEYPSVLKGLRKCRSIRADIRHKIEIIVQAYGGWRRGGLRQAAQELCVARQTLRRWYLWQTMPNTRLKAERLDNEYERALERIAAEKCRRRHRK